MRGIYDKMSSAKPIKPVKPKYVVVEGKAYELGTPETPKTNKKIAKPEIQEKGIVGFFKNAGRQSLLDKPEYKKGKGLFSMHK